MATKTKVRPTAAVTKAPPQTMDAPVQRAEAPLPPQTVPVRPGIGHNSQMPIVEGRAVAYNRAGQPIQRTAAMTGVDKFKIPEGVQPPGWSWEWKAEYVVGQKQEQHMAEQQKVGWEHVMYESYPGVFASHYDDNGQVRKGAVRRDGLVLMERAQILTDEAFADDKRRADERVGTSKRQYSAGLAEAAKKQTATAEYDVTAQRASYVRTATETLPPLDNRQQVD